MDLIRQAFGRFAPREDADAVVHFVLDLAIRDGRIAQLSALLDPNSKVGALEGDPGWLIERRDWAEDTAGWPPTADFRVWVDPRGFEFATQERKLSRAEFAATLRALTSAYLSEHPGSLEAKALLKGA